MESLQANQLESVPALSTADERAIDRVIRLMGRARRLLVITGAGMSADSGLPTYRGRDGLYHAERTTPHGVSIEQALSGPMLAAHPEITWHYLLELERSTRNASPNRGHQVIAAMDDYFDEVWTLTQNIDGLHQRAGSRNVLNLHGDLHDLECMRCDYRTSVPDYADLVPPPRCPWCQGTLRPSVVLFGEELPSDKFRLWYEFQVGFDLIFSIGTTSMFDYIAAPVLLGRRSGIPTVEINPESTTVSSEVDIKISARAAAVLDLLWDRYLACWPWA
jgi:NAD-dependent deacetylase